MCRLRKTTRLQQASNAAGWQPCKRRHGSKRSANYADSNKKGEKHVHQKDLYRIIHRRNDDNYGIWTKRCRAVLDKPGGRLGWHRNFRTGRAAAVQGTDEFHGRRQLYRIRRRRQLLRRQPGARRLGTDWRYKFTNLRGDVSPAFLRPGFKSDVPIESPANRYSKQLWEHLGRPGDSRVFHPRRNDAAFRGHGNGKGDAHPVGTTSVIYKRSF